MRKKKPTVRERKIAIDPDPRGNLKALGGAQYDDWNNWLASRTAAALPVNQKDDDRATEATVAVYSGMIDLKPGDPIEGILISQLVAAHQGITRNVPASLGGHKEFTPENGHWN